MHDHLLMLRLLTDASLFILIWIVQLIIYPGFVFYTSTDLVKWHAAYTARIAVIVAPLMLLQVILVAIQLFENMQFYTVLSAGLVGLVWLLTFVYFVPQHQKIADNRFSQKVLTQMVTVNWIRTALWTLLLLSSLMAYYHR